MTEIRVELAGLDELVAKATANHLLAAPLRQFLVSATGVVEAEAKTRAPVDTGFLRTSLRSETDGAGIPSWGEVRADAPYAAAVHEGTRPHMPPVQAILPWAARHGADPFAVARGIALHGTKPQPFLRKGFDAAEARVGSLLDQAAADIEARWGM